MLIISKNCIHLMRHGSKIYLFVLRINKNGAGDELPIRVKYSNRVYIFYIYNTFLGVVGHVNSYLIKQQLVLTPNTNGRVAIRQRFSSSETRFHKFKIKLIDLLLFGIK